MPYASPTRRQRRGLVAACVAAVGLTTTPVGATTSTRAANGDLRGVTTITWSGMAGIRLRVPRTVTIDEAGYRLTPRGASFVFVRMMPASELHKCRQRRPCSATALDWLRDLAETGGNKPTPEPYEQIGRASCRERVFNIV
jgi:hypothetical protein